MRCIICANGNNLPDGEYCRACGIDSEGKKYMTKEEAVELGVASQNAKNYFHILGQENTQTDPEKRASQTARYEAARAKMHEAMNRHHEALKQLGLLP